VVCSVGQFVVGVERCTAAVALNTDRNWVLALLHSLPALTVRDECSYPIGCVERTVVEAKHDSHRLAQLQAAQNESVVILQVDVEVAAHNLRAYKSTVELVYG
jgi:hypothetical protein